MPASGVPDSAGDDVVMPAKASTNDMTSEVQISFMAII